MIEVSRVVEIECHQWVADHVHRKAERHRLVEVPSERPRTVACSEPPTDWEGHQVGAVTVSVGYECHRAIDCEAAHMLGSGEVTVHHDNMTVPTSCKAFHGVVDGGIETLPNLPEHCGTTALSPLGHDRIVAHHMDGMFAACDQHAFGGPAGQLLTLCRRQRRLEALLGGGKTLDWHQDGGLHRIIVGMPAAAAAASGSSIARYRVIVLRDANPKPLPSITIGVLGGEWRAEVTPWGAIRGWPDPVWRTEPATLDWWVAADDRWHDPALEASVRQIRIDGTPVVETRVRIPNGDVVQRIFAVADGGGHTVIEVANDSPLPIAVAFHGTALLSARPPTDMPLAGINVPAGTVAFPVGHRSSITVAISHAEPRAGSLPATLSSAVSVANGWTTLLDRASRLTVPDPAAVTAVKVARTGLLLGGPALAVDDPVEFLLGVGELVRMGNGAEAWMPELAQAIGDLVDHRDDELLIAALDAAERVCLAANEPRAMRDLGKARLRLLAMPPGTAQRATTVSDDLSGFGSLGREIIAAEEAVARGSNLFPKGFPGSWFGQNFEVFDVPTGANSAVSLALRWHGPRPAVLWECSGAPVQLHAALLAPEWSTTELFGEALWPVPAGAEPAPATVLTTVPAADVGGGGDGVSFS